MSTKRQGSFIENHLSVTISKTAPKVETIPEKGTKSIICSTTLLIYYHHNKGGICIKHVETLYSFNISAKLR